MKIFLILFLILNCTVTSFKAKKEKLGEKTSIDFSFYEKSKSVLKFTKVKMADWEVPREGLIDLNDPVSKSNGLKEGLEPVGIFIYVLEHPKGIFIIDTGIAEVFKTPKDVPISSIVKSQMNFDKLKIHFTTKEYLVKNKINLNGVFATHLHLDHIMGGLDLPKNTKIFTGPKETSSKNFLNLFVRSSTDNLIGENNQISELEFSGVDSVTDLPTIDFFGDKSLLIFHTKGHTAGSLSFLISSTSGSHLVLGDTSHTKFGWEKNVPPGKFTENLDENRISLNKLQEIAKKIPKLKIHPGHQEIN